MKVVGGHTHSGRKIPSPLLLMTALLLYLNAKVHFQDINARPGREGAAQPYADFTGVCYSLG